jgi:hypothetical protein
MHPLIFTKNGLGNILGHFLINAAGHPCTTTTWALSSAGESFKSEEKFFFAEKCN